MGWIDGQSTKEHIKKILNDYYNISDILSKCETIIIKINMFLILIRKLLKGQYIKKQYKDIIF